MCIGKPFSFLEQSLTIKLKFFSPSSTLPYDKTKETHTSFGFLNSVTPEDFSFPAVLISWVQPLDGIKSSDLYSKYNGVG